MEQTVLFGRYRLIEPAGSGGTAEVWRALDERSGEEVALKRLHPAVFGSEGGRQRLVREFGALRGLRHPAVVRVRSLEMGRDDAALVLDFVPGASLRDRLAAGGRLPPREAARITADLAGALAAAHAAGIVHRDVSPGNVLLGKDGHARLTDFGIAREATEETSITQTGMLVGTLRYISPEQLRGEPATPRSDLYGLAAVTYEMLAGSAPFPATTPVGLVEAQRAGPPPIEGVDPAVDRVVRRGLARDPEARPRSVRVFASALAAAVGGIAVGGIAGGVAGGGDRAVAAGAGGWADAGDDPRRAALPVAVGAALALGALIVVASAMGGPSTGDVAAGAESPTPRPTLTEKPTETPPPPPADDDEEEDGDD